MLSLSRGNCFLSLYIYISDPIMCFYVFGSLNHRQLTATLIFIVVFDLRINILMTVYLLLLRNLVLFEEVFDEMMYPTL